MTCGICFQTKGAIVRIDKTSFEWVHIDCVSIIKDFDFKEDERNVEEEKESNLKCKVCKKQKGS